MIDKDLVLISTPIIFRYKGKSMKKVEWLITKLEKDGVWELPKIFARKAESTARASIRLAGEQLGLGARVLEEAGRAGGTTTINGKVFPQRQLYYVLILEETPGGVIEFAEVKWLDYAGAVRKLSTKRDRQMIKGARKEYRIWEKKPEDEKGFPPEEKPEPKPEKKPTKKK